MPNIINTSNHNVTILHFAILLCCYYGIEKFHKLPKHRLGATPWEPLLGRAALYELHIKVTPQEPLHVYVEATLLGSPHQRDTL